MKVYLAGPITGQSYEGASSWSEAVKKHFDLENNIGLEKKHNIDCYLPMRGKAYLSKEERIADSYSDYTMSSITGINVRDYNDVKTADCILANFLGCKGKVSIGTVMEIAWARAFQKPIIIVMEKDNVHDHGMLTFGNIIVRSVDEGIEAIKQILLP